MQNHSRRSSPIPWNSSTEFLAAGSLVCKPILWPESGRGRDRLGMVCSACRYACVLRDFGSGIRAQILEIPHVRTSHFNLRDLVEGWNWCTGCKKLRHRMQSTATEEDLNCRLFVQIKFWRRFVRPD